MPSLRCKVWNCIHIDRTTGFCGVADTSTVDIGTDGNCIDCAPVTNKEYKKIFGVDRPKGEFDK
jgi:hypothetical protein